MISVWVQCLENGKIEVYDCPTEPPVIIPSDNIALRLFIVILNAVGVHGIVGFFGSILLVLGFIKLMFGGICCCRKTKAQKHYDKQIKKGVKPKGVCFFYYIKIWLILKIIVQIQYWSGVLKNVEELVWLKLLIRKN